MGHWERRHPNGHIQLWIQNITSHLHFDGANQYPITMIKKISSSKVNIIGDTRFLCQVSEIFIDTNVKSKVQWQEVVHNMDIHNSCSNQFTSFVCWKSLRTIKSSPWSVWYPPYKRIYMTCFYSHGHGANVSQWRSFQIVDNLTVFIHFKVSSEPT